MTLPTVHSRRVLDPNDRISEVLFGLIMVLTFTGSLSVSEAVHDDVKEMLIGALGCNIAWGIIDGVLYLMGSLAEKGTNLKTYLAVRAATDAANARELIADALPPVVAGVMQPGELDSIHQRLKQLPHPPAQAKLDGTDWKGFLGVFLLVFLTTFPPTIPFIFMDQLDRAMRVSNGIAIAMLFIAGIAYGRLVGRSAWGIGAFMVVLGLVLVAMTIALGG
jgi:VIT1/CCC1 family predicted Fe2+/Mn2+ transporter